MTSKQLAAKAARAKAEAEAAAKAEQSAIRELMTPEQQEQWDHIQSDCSAPTAEEPEQTEGVSLIPDFPTLFLNDAPEDEDPNAGTDFFVEDKPAPKPHKVPAAVATGWIADVDDLWHPIERIGSISVQSGGHVTGFVDGKSYQFASFPGDSVAAQQFRLHLAEQIARAKGHKTPEKD